MNFSGINGLTFFIKFHPLKYCVLNENLLLRENIVIMKFLLFLKPNLKRFSSKREQLSWMVRFYFSFL